MSRDANAAGSLARTSIPERSTTYARTPVDFPSSSSLARSGASEMSASTAPIGSWPSAGRTGTARTRPPSGSTPVKSGSPTYVSPRIAAA